MKKFNYLFILLLTCFLSKAQVMVTNGVPANPTPNTNAILELYSVNHNKGLLMPKVSLAATDNPSPLPAHIAGITVYNTNTAAVTQLTSVSPGLYYNNGTSWNRLEVEAPATGDIKYSSTATDHDGWYLLNGRNISTLSATAQASATSLGFTTTLPNSADRFLKAKAATETLGAVGGNSSATLTQANLPNVAYTNVATQTTGAHTHTYNDRANGSLQSTEGGTTQTVVDDGAATLATSALAAHTHTFSISTGGSGTPLNLQPKYLSAYIFVYLGQ
jgi:microcystin-dependent protein